MNASTTKESTPPQGGKKLYIRTYGCQSNVYDSDRMVDILKPFGYTLADSQDEADLIILNTCHIRENAEKKLFSDLGRLRVLQNLQKDEGKDLMIGVAGCVAQGVGAGILRRAPHVNMVFGPQTYHMLPQMIAQAARQKQSDIKGPGRGIVMLDFPAESKFDFFPEENEPRGPVAFLAIQEGCDKFCTYCVVPYTRGAEFSRPVTQVMQEARRMVMQGTQELILLGQNVNAYHGLGDGRPGECSHEWGLPELIRLMAEELTALGLKRLRYTTSYPRDVTQELVAVHRDVSLLMPFLHLPVQSGSDKVLKEMNRKHTGDFFRRLIEQFRMARPDMAFSSDFIVGFPGESEEDFEATLRLIDDVQFAQAYSFKYSPRPGTPAALRKDQIPEDVKNERLQILQARLNKQQLAFNQQMVGKTLSLLIERPGHAKHAGQWIGRSPYMQSVHVIAPHLKGGDYVNVFIEAGHSHSLQGRFIDHAS